MQDDDLHRFPRYSQHAALGVAEDQYTIVHKYLFRAIADVLGDAVT